MASSLLSSRAVFRSRAAELMLEPAAVEKAEAENIASMGQYGFACRFVPGFKYPFIEGFRMALKEGLFQTAFSRQRK